MWPFGKKKDRFSKNSECVLMIRFDIDKIQQATGGSNYGYACYTKVFASIPLVDPLVEVVDTSFYMGDSQATLNGEENVCIVALEGNYGNVKAIDEYIQSPSCDLTNYCAVPPTVITKKDHDEPLVYDGYITISSDAPFSEYGIFEKFVGEQNAVQAISAFEAGVLQNKEVQKIINVMKRAIK